MGAIVCAGEVLLRDVVLVISSTAFLTNRSSSCTLVSWETSSSSAFIMSIMHFSVALHAVQQRMENVSLQRHLQIINPIIVMITEVRTNIPVCSFVG